MKPRIEEIKEKKLAGKRLRMSLVNDQTGLLWHSFMPLRKEVPDKVNADFISMRVYDNTPDFAKHNPHEEFDKWAAVEVTGFDKVTAVFETFTIPAGLYAVFFYKGASSAGEGIFKYIFAEWLPASEYKLDNRPHFEILGEKYKNNHPDSEEELWIPITKK